MFPQPPQGGAGHARPHHHPNVVAHAQFFRPLQQAPKPDEQPSSGMTTPRGVGVGGGPSLVVTPRGAPGTPVRSGYQQQHPYGGSSYGGPSYGGNPYAGGPQSYSTPRMHAPPSPYAQHLPGTPVHQGIVRVQGFSTPVQGAGDGARYNVHPFPQSSMSASSPASFHQQFHPYQHDGRAEGPPRSSSRRLSTSSQPDLQFANVSNINGMGMGSRSRSSSIEGGRHSIGGGAAPLAHMHMAQGGYQVQHQVQGQMQGQRPPVPRPGQVYFHGTQGGWMAHGGGGGGHLGHYGRRDQQQLQQQQQQQQQQHGESPSHPNDIPAVVGSADGGAHQPRRLPFSDPNPSAEDPAAAHTEHTDAGTTVNGSANNAQGSVGSSSSGGGSGSRNGEEANNQSNDSSIGNNANATGTAAPSRPTIPPLVIPLSGGERSRTGVTGSTVYGDVTTPLAVAPRSSIDALPSGASDSSGGGTDSDTNNNTNTADNQQDAPATPTKAGDSETQPANSATPEQPNHNDNNQSQNGNNHRRVIEDAGFGGTEPSASEPGTPHPIPSRDQRREVSPLATASTPKNARENGGGSGSGTDEKITSGTTASESSAGLGKGVGNQAAGSAPQLDERTTWTVSLRCPLSKKRMTDPVIGADCKHRHRCFDRVTMHCAWPTGFRKCPVCKKPIDLGTLATDEVVLRALAVMAGNTVEISGDEGHIRDPEESAWKPLF